jgi:predicted nucleic acid-binding protein
MPRLIVPDASVILKWAFRSPDEQDADQALHLLHAWLNEHCDFLLPRLWLFEAGNVIGLKNPKLAADLLDVLTGYRFPEAETSPELCRETLRIMAKCHVTFYDAVYHATAILNNGNLVTADDAYCRKAHGLGHIVRLVDWREV